MLQIWYFEKLWKTCETLMPGSWPQLGKDPTGLRLSRALGLITWKTLTRGHFLDRGTSIT